MSTPLPTFSGEVQLRRWSESSTQGVQVTFALADSDDLEPLKAKSGKRFMAVLVEIGDDERPVEPPMGPLCKWLVMRCNEPEFWAFLEDEVTDGHPVQNDVYAGEVVKQYLEIESRKEVDTCKFAETRCKTLIVHPYQKWLVRRGVTA